MLEVRNAFIDYEEKNHEFIQNTQAYFLKNGFNMYVWVDNLMRVRLKYKHRRGSPLEDIDEQKSRLTELVKKFSEEEGLEIKYILYEGEEVLSLPEDRRLQWATEYILEVKV